MPHARNIDIDESGDVSIDSPCTIRALQASNTNAAVLFLKLYDTDEAPDENDTPVATFGIPISGQIQYDFPKNGLVLAAGLGVRATTGAADDDTGAPGANDCVGFFSYDAHRP